MYRLRLIDCLIYTDISVLVGTFPCYWSTRAKQLPKCESLTRCNHRHKYLSEMRNILMILTVQCLGNFSKPLGNIPQTSKEGLRFLKLFFSICKEKEGEDKAGQWSRGDKTGQLGRSQLCAGQDFSATCSSQHVFSPARHPWAHHSDSR